MSSEIRIGEPSRCLSPFLFDAWLAFLRAKWDMKATIGDDRELAVGGNGLLSGAREYRAPSDAVNTQFSASRKIVCRLNQNVRGTHLETQEALASVLLNPISALLVS